MTDNGVKGVKDAIGNIFDQKKHQLFLLAQDYAQKCIEEFKNEQLTGPGNKGKYWTNRTGNASSDMFTEAYTEDYLVAWFLSHGTKIPYGVYLTLSNNRQNDALTPLIDKWGQKFIQAARELYAT